MHNDASSNIGEDDSTRLKLMEAIATRVLITATYNGQILTLAPHALITRREELYLKALNLTKAWRSEEEKRLGLFKLEGLTGVSVGQETFTPLPLCETAPSPLAEELVFAVEAV